MKTAGTPGPELHFIGNNSPPTPELGPWDIPVFILKFALHLLEFPLYLSFTHNCALWAAPSSHPASQGSAGVVLIALLRVDYLCPTEHADLLVNLPPEKYQRCAGILPQFFRLARVVIGEENEAARIDLFEEDHAC